MEIRFYTPELNMIGVMEDHTSLLWTRKFHESGSFQLTAPITEYNVKLCQIGNVISIEGANEAAVIECVTIRQNNLVRVVICVGRMLSSYMDRRLIRPRFNFNGTVEDAMRTILSNAYPLPLVRLGVRHGFPETIEFQATYKNLLTYMTKLSKGSNIGFRFTPDFTEKTLTFDTYKGVDHSVHQSERVRVVFSEEFQNIGNTKYVADERNYKNVAYAGGRGEGDNRVYVQVGDNTISGLERRETFLNATDIEQTEGMSGTSYTNALKTRAEQRLSEHGMIINFECTSDPNGNFKYRQDFDLGDIITVEKESWNLSYDLMVTEVQEVYEHGLAQITPILGTTLPEVIDWEDR